MISEDRIENLTTISKSIKRKLISNGYVSISQIKELIDHNQEEKIRSIYGIGDAKFKMIEQAVKTYIDKDAAKVEPEEEEKKEEEIKTIDDSLSMVTQIIPISKFKLKDQLIIYIAELLNDPNVPKYHCSSRNKYPSNNIIYEDVNIYVKLDWIETKFNKYIDAHFNIIEMGNADNIDVFRFSIANWRFIDDSPIWFNTGNDNKKYAFSSYTKFCGGDDKYIKLIRNNLVKYLGYPLDLSISKELQLDYQKFVDSYIDEINISWISNKKPLTEMYINQKKYDSAFTVCKDFCNDYKAKLGSYQYIDDNLVETLKTCLRFTKDNKSLNEISKLIGQVESDNGISGMVSTTQDVLSTSKATAKPTSTVITPTPVIPEMAPEEIKSIKKVLDNDLQNLDEETKKDILHDILPPTPPTIIGGGSKMRDFTVFINGCMRFGDVCNAMITVITKVKTDDKFNFTTVTHTGSYQFTKDNLEGGQLLVPDEIKDKSSDIKKALLEELNSL